MQYLLPLLILYLFVFSITVAPSIKSKKLSDEVQQDSLYCNSFDPSWNHSGLQELIRSKTYKEALLKMASNDSIQLSIDLNDSIIALSIQGVTIHTAPVFSIETDRLLNGLSALEYTWIFSKPLEVHSQIATIVKEPIVVRQAPKDPVEAANQAWQPDTLIQNPAYLLLSLEYGIDIIIEQEKNLSLKDRIVRFSFYGRQNVHSFYEHFVRFLTFKSPDYKPQIRIKTNVDDLRAIYRALPSEAFVSIKLP